MDKVVKHARPKCTKLTKGSSEKEKESNNSHLCRHGHHGALCDWTWCTWAPKENAKWKETKTLYVSGLGVTLGVKAVMQNARIKRAECQKEMIQCPYNIV